MLNLFSRLFFKIEKIQQEKDIKKIAKKQGPDEISLLFKPVAELQKLGKGEIPKSLTQFH